MIRRWAFIATAALFCAICLLPQVQPRARDVLDFSSEVPESGDDPVLSSKASQSTSGGPSLSFPALQGVHRTESIIASFTSFGTWGQGFAPGWTDVPGWPRVSFESPPGSGAEYLFGGALWIGGIVEGDTLVSVGADGWHFDRELFPPEYPPRGSVTKYDYISDQALRAEYADTVDVSDWFGRPHQPLNIRVANRSYSWHDLPEGNAIIYDLVITNIGSKTIKDGFVGLYMDADVCVDCGNTAGFTDDIAGSLQKDEVAYIIDNDGDLRSAEGYSVPKAFAVKLIKTSFGAKVTNFNWWLPNGNGALDFGPRQRGTPEHPFRDFGTGGTGTPVGDANKYYVMSFPEWDYDQIFTASIAPDDPEWMYPLQVLAGDFASGFDARFLLSTGPFDLMPDSSVRLLFSTVTADSVHTDPGNILNLPESPEMYLKGLNLRYLRHNAARSSRMARRLLDPRLPVTGLQMEYQDRDSTVIEWDPWVFKRVEGYEVFVTEVRPNILPYPGLTPPWLRPDEPELYSSVGCTYYTTIDELSTDRMYFVNVANRTNGGRAGNIGVPIVIHPGGRPLAPTFEQEFSFKLPNEPAQIEWIGPDGDDIDHYNVYRFIDRVAASQRHHPFYSEQDLSPNFVPNDTFHVDGKTYFYYAVGAYAEVDSGQRYYDDYAASDGMVYVVTAVNTAGFESEFSSEVTLLVIETVPRTKDILVITGGQRIPPHAVASLTVKSFYDSILTGYDYVIFDPLDSLLANRCHDWPSECVGWQYLAPYKLVIIDERIIRDIYNAQMEHNTLMLTKYLLSGGRVAFFTELFGFGGNWLNSDFKTRLFHDKYLSRFFGVDSVTQPGLLFYEESPALEQVDTLFGFQQAETLSDLLPGVAFDTTRYPFHAHMQQLFEWPTNAPPCVTTFKVNEIGTPTHVYRSAFPASSLQEGQYVGVKTVTPISETFLFGFHLWYMNHAEARRLIEAILPQSSNGRPARELIGDLNGDNAADMSELTLLVKYFFANGPEPSVAGGGDMNQDGLIDIVDITRLVLQLFGSRP